MVWTVNIHAHKSIEQLLERAKRMRTVLITEMGASGPVRGNWQNYSKLAGNRHHCHIKKGRPCYVAVWEVTDNTIRIL